MLLLSHLHGSAKFATHISLVAVAMLINYFLFYGPQLLIRTEYTTCGRRFVCRHEVISVPTVNNTLRPLYHFPATSPSNCLCGHPNSRLLLTEITLGEPTTEVHLNRPY